MQGLLNPYPRIINRPPSSSYSNNFMQLQLQPSRKVMFHDEPCNCTIIRSMNRGEEYLSLYRMRGEHLFSIPAIVTIAEHELDTVPLRDISKEGEITSL